MFFRKRSSKKGSMNKCPLWMKTLTLLLAFSLGASFVFESGFTAQAEELPGNNSNGVFSADDGFAITIKKPVLNAPSTANLTAVATNSDGEAFRLPTENGKLDLSGLSDGSYSLMISANNCASRSYSITVANGIVSGLEDGIKLHLLGDMDGDGFVEIMDIATVNMHVKGLSLLTDYDLIVSDVNNDGVVDILDVGKMNAHLKQTLTVWDKVAVTFESNGGSEVASQTVTSGEQAICPANPVRDGYIFVGWYSDSDLRVLYNFNSSVTSDITLYARWREEAEEERTFLDENDADVEIYSFSTDTWDILVDTEETVTFTAEIFTNVELEANEIRLMDKDSNLIGYMHDDGNDGDAVEGDGIYSLTTLMHSNSAETEEYHVEVRDAASSGITLGFYKNYSEEELNEFTDVIEEIGILMADYLDDEGYILDGKMDEAAEVLSAKLNEWKTDGIVEDYTIDGNIFEIILSSGAKYWYNLAYAGTDSTFTVISNQPYKNTYSAQLQRQSDDATDGSARMVAETFAEYSFYSGTSGNELNTFDDDNYDAAEVSLEALMNLADAQVVTWHGHGGYTQSYGSFIGTGTVYSQDIHLEYIEDFNAGRILVAGNQLCITGGFIQKYCDDMTGHFIYLGTCSSGEDMVDGIANRYELAQAFINKGAAAVIGNTATIHTDYNTRMERDVFKGLCTTDANGEYFTLSRALDYARQLNGAQDYGEDHHATVEIFPQNNRDAANYRLHERHNENETGTVSGVVRDASTSRNVPDALIRAYSPEGNFITSVRSDDSGFFNIQLPAGDYVLKVTAGHYKSTKMAITVAANETVYAEAFLLLDAGLSSGFVNGRITNAVVSDQGVPDVTISLRFGWNNQRGTVLHTTTTNENGYYEITYSVGAYTIEYSKFGFVTGYMNIVIGPIDLSAKNAVISPLNSEGVYRITLSWENEPLDLDAHLAGPLPNGGRFHIYYPYADANGGSPYPDYVKLDLDNTNIRARSDSETTTIVQQLDGPYVFSVHDYSNGGSANSTAMARSNATIRVFKGDNTQVEVFHVPTNAEGTIWTVFELNGDVITPINRIGNGFDSNHHLFDPYLDESNQANPEFAYYNDHSGYKNAF